MRVAQLVINNYSIMPSMFTVVSWLPVPLVLQVTGPRATTVNIGLSIPCGPRKYKTDIYIFTYDKRMIKKISLGIT